MEVRPTLAKCCGCACFLLSFQPHYLEWIPWKLWSWDHSRWNGATSHWAARMGMVNGAGGLLLPKLEPVRAADVVAGAPRGNLVVIAISVLFWNKPDGRFISEKSGSNSSEGTNVEAEGADVKFPNWAPRRALDRAQCSGACSIVFAPWRSLQPGEGRGTGLLYSSCGCGVWNLASGSWQRCLWTWLDSHCKGFEMFTHAKIKASSIFRPNLVGTSSHNWEHELILLCFRLY